MLLPQTSLGLISFVKDGSQLPDPNVLSLAVSLLSHPTTSYPLVGTPTQWGAMSPVPSVEPHTLGILDTTKIDPPGSKVRMVLRASEESFIGLDSSQNHPLTNVSLHIALHLLPRLRSFLCPLILEALGCPTATASRLADHKLCSKGLWRQSPPLDRPSSIPLLLSLAVLFFSNRPNAPLGYRSIKPPKAPPIPSFDAQRFGHKYNQSPIFRSCHKRPTAPRGTLSRQVQLDQYGTRRHRISAATTEYIWHPHPEKLFRNTASAWACSFPAAIVAVAFTLRPASPERRTESAAVWKHIRLTNPHWASSMAPMTPRLKILSGWSPLSQRF
ncbi:hypothetical protein SODALDRAFT_361246 [Sodiomyces alkalinus F11]|uniref:Uncharacterized protein n=1 Tax=Sodiomyces alkalinus (strain CBS 110278 / VKM F-3762 / F11) TaxID=1314773 RepID=A0A3N2PSP6_SODAK|nr:hypothetical protein SODALDRAFT_361246 [Sodiomyces alkalinus F11]ROT37532.1 hypothetical protein SODALDRAFT_361246 [Sodiomyces alkalinus F11]